MSIRRIAAAGGAVLAVGTMVVPTLADAPIALELIGRHETGVFDEGASEIVAYDAGSQRLFVINAFAATVDVLDLADPSRPTLIFTIDVSPYGAVANSVAAQGGLIAVAVQADPKTDPGSVAFFDCDGTFLKSVAVGAQPDMIAFTPDGTKVLTANEAEPNDDYTVDPEGSVSIVDVSDGIDNVGPQSVFTADFGAFNGADLGPYVRIFGPNATAAQDIEPEYIAVSPDSSTAWVTLQENNAVAVVDLASATVTQIVGLPWIDHVGRDASLETYEFTNLPLLGTTAAGQDIQLGGFSGLFFDGVDAQTGRYRFLTHPDRGPNAEPVDVDNDGILERPFPLPDFQLEVDSFEFDPATGELTITNRLGLTRADGTPITGRPNLQGQSQGLAHTDEEPIDLFGNPLDNDPFGGDIEGIVRTPDGTLWLCDEYRPALYHFDADGVLIERFVPEGSNGFGVEVGTEAFPAVWAQRRSNRGFEAIAYQEGTIYAFIQSPLDNPDLPNDNSSKTSLNNRILAFDIATSSTVGEYLYRIEGGGSDKVGDAVSLRPGEFLVIERDSAFGPTAKKKIFHIDLRHATNLLDLDQAIVGPGGTLEGMSAEQLADAGIVPVSKEVYVDLAAIGFSSVDKAEGLALLHGGLLAVVNDNDFQLEGTFDPDTGLLTPNPSPQPALFGLITLGGNGIDASDQDSSINIRSWPVLGMRQPDAIASFQAGGETYLITANEGDARDYDGFAEEERVKDLDLDPVYFPMAAQLKANANLGRLTVTTATGDENGDGLFESLHPFGGRSVTIWTTDGSIVWDSKELFEQTTAAAFPANFNASNDNNAFDNRSDNKGPEPEGVAVGTIGDRTYAFVGLERIGGIVTLDITDPAAPVFVQYINPRDFGADPESGGAGDLGPEGIVFIPASDSPSKDPLLVVGNEVSGSTAVYRIGPAPAFGDLNGDGVVDGADLGLLLSAWGPCPRGGACAADLDGDRDVDRADLGLLLAAWT
ncbi:MAG: choice-of-anchor I family protein, partial [Phycisphaerales bacterium]|nr:choice-of-anchor I family protein [Phycisphaerales bacterium]